MGRRALPRRTGTTGGDVATADSQQLWTFQIHNRARIELPRETRVFRSYEGAEAALVERLRAIGLPEAAHYVLSTPADNPQGFGLAWDLGHLVGIVHTLYVEEDDDETNQKESGHETS